MYWGYELDDPRSSGCDNTECMDVGHDIVSSLFFFLGSDIELLPIQMLYKIPHAECKYVRYPALRRKSEGEGEGRTRLFFICSMASSGIGSPSSFSAMARLSHSFLQVWCRFC